MEPDKGTLSNQKKHSPIDLHVPLKYKSNEFHEDFLKSHPGSNGTFENQLL